MEDRITTSEKNGMMDKMIYNAMEMVSDAMDFISWVFKACTKDWRIPVAIIGVLILKNSKLKLGKIFDLKL